MTGNLTILSTLLSGQTHAIRIFLCVTALWGIAGVATIILWRGSAAVRHRIWALACAASLVLPALIFLLPEVRIGPPAQIRRDTVSPMAANPVESRSIIERGGVTSDARLAVITPKTTSPNPEPDTAGDRSSWLVVSWQAWLIVAWVIPFIWLMVRHGRAIRAAKNMIASATPITNEPMLQTFTHLVGKMALRRIPALVESRHTTSPLFVGSVHSAIVLPESWRGWSLEHMGAVLTHELAHAHRRDVLWQGVARLACAVYWFHPMAWVAARRMRLEREIACDDWVLRGGQSATVYARWLLDLATALRAATAMKMPDMAAVAMAAHVPLERRIAAIFDPQRKRLPVSRRAGFNMILTSVIALLFLSTLNPLAPREVRAVSPDGTRTVAQLLQKKESPTDPTNSKPARIIPVSVMDAEGRPIAGAWVVATSDLYNVGESTTDASGHASVRVPIDMALDYVLATKERVGLDYALFWRKDETHNDPYHLEPDFAGTIKLTLNGAKSVTIHATDDRHKPLGGVTVSPWYFEKPKHGGVLNLSGIVFSRTIDAGGAVTVRNLGENAFSRPTDAGGAVRFNTIPADQMKTIQFNSYLDGYTASNYCLVEVKDQDADATTVLIAKVQLTGKVLDQEGKPADGATVQICGFDRDAGKDFQETVKTGPEGNFVVRVAANMYYLFMADRGRTMSIGERCIINRESPESIQLKLLPSTRIFGTLTAGPTHKPVAGELLCFQQSEGHPLIPEWKTTDVDGNFEFFASQGEWNLFEYHQNTSDGSVSRVVVKDEAEIRVNLVASHEKSGLRPLNGRVVEKEHPERNVAETLLSSYATGSEYGNVGAGVADGKGSFAIDRPDTDVYLYATNVDRSLGGITHIAAKDDTVTVAISPTASAHGRVVDSSGTPAVNRTVRFDIHFVSSPGNITERFGGTVKTGADGAYKIDGLVTGYAYEVMVVMAEDSDGVGRSYRSLGVAKAVKAENVDLGEFKIP